MDVHREVGLDAAAFADSYRQDLAVQDTHDVTFRAFWIDEDEGVAFCLFDGPSKAAGQAVHREAHGHIANEIFEVRQGGSVPAPDDDVMVDTVPVDRGDAK